MEEIRNVSDKHMTSISLIFLYPSMRDNSWAARPFKFQQQNLRTELLRDPGLDSISRDFSNIKFFMYKQYKRTDSNKKPHNW